MATTLHRVDISVTDGVVDLFDVATAVPPIPAGVAGYIQNISNREVLLSNALAFETYLIIGSKTDQPAISTLTFEAGDAVFLKVEHREAILTVAIPV